MRRRRVRFTTTAKRHVEHERAWWLEQRAHTELFAVDLERALEILSVLPGVGAPYAQAGIVGLRRLYLRTIDCHLYYTFDKHEVKVRALWGARRRRPPSLRS